MFRRLQRPYTAERNPVKQLQLAALFGAFVFVFLFFFRPFGLDGLQDELFTVTLGYGATTFLTMILLNVVVPRLVPSYFMEDRWTVGRELAWSLVNIALIGAGNVVYSAWLEIMPVTLRGLMVFELYTLAIGVFPVSVNVLAREARLTRRYAEGSELMNSALPEKKVRDNNVTPVTEAGHITITSDNEKESITLAPAEFLFIKASDNYVEIHYSENGRVSRKVLRHTLKKISGSLVHHPGLFRCHKSYLVNLRNVIRVTGNAQGYKLHFPGVDFVVPVSRQYNDQIKDLLGG